jgi:hypothetical protein
LTGKTGSESVDDCFEVSLSVVATTHKLWLVVEMEAMPEKKAYEIYVEVDGRGRFLAQIPVHMYACAASF